MESTTMESRVSFSSSLALEWVKLKNLGEGSYGVVDLVMIIKPHVPRLLAVKSSPSPSPSLQKEYRILRGFLGYPNIVQCYGQTSSIEHEVEYHNLFLDYAAGGNLLNLIAKYGGKMPESDVRCYTRMILEGLCHVHKKGYVHCDIKPGNILVYPSHHQSGSLNTLKIADFGVAKEPGKRDAAPPRLFQGTARYMSPESVEHGIITAALDIWSLGCVIVEMMTGEPPWESSVTELKDLVMLIAFSRESPDIPQDMSMAGKDFLMKCFARDPFQRWTADRLIRHPFLIPDSTLMATVAPKNKILLPHALMQKSKFRNQILLPHDLMQKFRMAQ